MSVLFQFPAIMDEKATARKVMIFFKEDVQNLRDICKQSENQFISSPSFDGISYKQENVNSTENAIVNSIDAKRELKIINATIDECSPEYAQLLKFAYIYQLNPVKASMKMAMSTRTYQRHLTKARIEFAIKYAAKNRNLIEYRKEDVHDETH